MLGSIYYGAEAVLLWFLLLGPVLLITILCHELGHCLAARSVGGTVQGILLWPLGGLAFIGHDAGPKADIWVAVAGPLTHIPMIGMWVGFLSLATHNASGSWAPSLEVPYPSGAKNLAVALCAGAVIMNLSLMAFNLFVPAYPLDGGRIFVDTMLIAGVRPDLTAKVTCAVATLISVGLIVWGCVQFQLITILVACFILFSTWQLFQHVRLGTLGQHPMFAFTMDAAEAEANYWKLPGPSHSIPQQQQV